MVTPEPTRALIVEDDPVVARSIARRLLHLGYTVSLAQTCRAGRAAGLGFQVAVLDLDLPDGSGADLADELLRVGAVRNIVFYTGSLNVAERERAERFGAVIDKGRDLADLIAALEPFAAAPPISHSGPAARPRPRVSGARLTRVAPEDEAPSIESAASTSSSRR
ncbi:MAG TPA: response regulator [Polyangiaceae bacterium]|nr:response regulator [Polyangiaceae bacterium]